MPHTFHDLQIAMVALQRGEMTVGDVLPIARQHSQSARTIAFGVLQEENQQSLLNNSPAAKMVDFLWKLDGFRIFKTFPALGETRPLVFNYICEEIRQRPDQFSDEDLRFITTMNPFDSYTASLAQKVQTSRVAKKAAQARALPEELNRDAAAVQQRISRYDFDPELNDLLDKVDLNLGVGDGFDQAATLKHLRTFFEKIHESVGQRLRQAKPETVDGTPLDSCGQVIGYLQRKDVLTAKMESLAKGLYGVLSHEGVHAIKAEREYVRLCRNMVTEYAARAVL